MLLHDRKQVGKIREQEEYLTQMAEIPEGFDDLVGGGRILRPSIFCNQHCKFSALGR
jgi:hypothetical protein